MSFREGGRCGHCGRTFTFAQWVKYKYWCSDCGKYICFECLGPKKHCPECGTKMGIDIDRWFFTFLTAFSILFAMSILFSILIVIDPETDPRNIVVVPLMSSPFFIGLSILYPFVRKRKRSHLRTISEMPKGMIPKKDRNESGLAILERNYRPIKGIFPEGVDDGLKCYWMQPVMSREQFMEHQKGVRNKVQIMAVITIILGIIGAIIPIILSSMYFILIIGICLVIFGILLFVVNIVGKNLDKKDRERGTAAFWKKVGFNNTYQNVEKYLHERGLQNQKTVQSNTAKSKWTNPFYKYHIGSDLRIETHYVEQRNGEVTGHLQIVYKDSSWKMARKIEYDLDKRFIQMDLLQSRASTERRRFL